MKEMTFQLIDIVEDSFNIDLGKIPKNKENINIAPGFGFGIQIKPKEKRIGFNGVVEYYINEEKVVTYSFTMWVAVDDSSKYIVSEKQIEAEEYHGEIRLPPEFLELIINEMYSTARGLIRHKLSDTALKDEFLPLGGAKDLLEKIRKEHKNPE